MIMDLQLPKNFENLTNMADQLPGYQVLIVLEKAASPPTTAALNNGDPKALSGSRLTMLMR